jgi:asparagine synthase (glutamine-hydrolysing)
MCGICGIIRFDKKPVQEASIRKMMQIMKHRGPDDEGVFTDDNGALGFVRLSIIDLSLSGHQPKLSQDERYVIVFNGEIYNYIELREELIREGVFFNSQTDTEVLLNAYLNWGEDCLNHFNGMWAFAIYDREKETTFIARDRFGIKPLYYLYTKEYFAFCSEIPPLLPLLDKKPTPDNQSIFDFLVFNRTDQTERTFFSEIKKLQHGCKLTIDGSSQQSIINDQQLKIVKWYDLRDRVLKTEGFKSPEEFKDLFSSAIGLHLRSDVPVGVCLSGGLDSSAIVSILLHDLNKSDLNTFSAVYNKGQIGDETEFINEYKTSIKNMFFTSPDGDSLKEDLSQFVKAHGEPIPSTNPYAQYKVMKLAQGKVVVTLDGQGADEELAGYHYFFGFYFKDLLIHGRLTKLCIELYHYLTIHRSLMGIKSFLFFLLPKRLRTKARVNEKGYLIADFVNQYKNSNLVTGNIYGSKSLADALLDHFEYKLEHLLKWEDRNSMWFSLESRLPFLDFRLVEKTLATKSDWKIKNGMTKFILREAMNGILSEKIRLRRDKIGFETPQDEWLREPIWQNIIKEILFSESFRARNLIDPKLTQELYQKHILGEINVANEIWKWIHLELWFREFIDADNSFFVFENLKERAINNPKEA